MLPPQHSEEVRLVWEYVRAVAKYWWLVIVALGLTWLDLAERIFGTWYTPPLWARITAGVAGLTVAQFLAYRDLRKSERAELRHLNERNAELSSQADLLKVRPYGHAHKELAQTQLINRIERPKLGRAGIDSFWQVRPEFVDVLRDLLFPRREQVQQNFFLS